MDVTSMGVAMMDLSSRGRSTLLSTLSLDQLLGGPLGKMMHKADNMLLEPLKLANETESGESERSTRGDRALFSSLGLWEGFLDVANEIHSTRAAAGSWVLNVSCSNVTDAIVSVLIAQTLPR